MLLQTFGRIGEQRWTVKNDEGQSLFGLTDSVYRIVIVAIQCIYIPAMLTLLSLDAGSSFQEWVDSAKLLRKRARLVKATRAKWLGLNQVKAMTIGLGRVVSQSASFTWLSSVIK